MKVGCVYVLGNDAMPGILKIGRTTRSAEHRARELSLSSGVPLPFKVLMFSLTDEPAVAEHRLHHVLARWRVSRSREFFRIDANTAYEKLDEVVGLVEFTPTGNEWLEKATDEICKYLDELREKEEQNS